MRKESIHSAAAYGVEMLERRVLMARALGIDVSHWQGTINWTSVKSVKDFAFIKATGSDAGNYTDSQYNTNFTNATSAGMLFGVYHFADPTSATSAAAQADYFYSKAANAMTAGHLPPVLDLERGPTDSATISAWANAFCTEVYNKSGVKPLIYSSSGTYASYVNSTVTSQWQLWVANYGSSNGVYTDTSAAVQTGSGPSNGSWPAGSWKFWQYNSVGSVSGISGNVDSDVFHGDVTALQTMVITAPEVTVTKAGAGITDGQAAAIDFGTANAGSTGPSVSFVVKNDGGSIMNLSGLTVPSGFQVTDTLVSTLLPGASDTFTVQMLTTSTGTKSGNISFTNNDPNENPFNFPITGTVGDSTPAAPTNLAVSGYTSSSVSLGWTDNSNNETLFLIERKTGAGGAYAQVGSVGTNIVSFPDSFNLAPGTTYFYRVRATNAGQTYSGYSNEVSVITLPATPTNLAASDGSFADHIALTWDAASGASNYQLYRSLSNDPATASLLAPTSSTSYDDYSASANVTYYYWVAGRNSGSVLGAKSASDSGFLFVDTTGPTIVDKWFDFTGASPTVNFKFSESVGGSLNQNSLSLANLDGGATPAITGYSYGGANVATYTLDWSIATDNYRATVAGATDPSSNPLTGSNTLDFAFLRGDANGNGVIDSPDFAALATHFGQSNPGYVNGDFNNDGIVNALDFNVLASDYGQSVPAPPAAQPLGSLFSNKSLDSSSVGNQILTSI